LGAGLAGVVPPALTGYAPSYKRISWAWIADFDKGILEGPLALQMHYPVDRRYPQFQRHPFRQPTGFGVRKPIPK
jgi:hypothetical protein